MRSNAQAWRQVKEQLRAVGRLDDMCDQDKPTTPPSTPPAITLGNKTGVSSKARAAGGPNAVPRKSAPDKGTGQVEEALSAAQKGGRDGQGEAALDTPNTSKD